MKKSIFLSTTFALIFALSLGVVSVLANENSDDNSDESTVSSIVLETKSDNKSVEWETDGTSPKGFKIVWSKNENPTYPTRDGDKYYYTDDANADHYNFKHDDSFSGAGTYYVRVCEYLGGECGVYSNQVTVDLEESVTRGYEPGKEMLTSITLRGDGNNIKWEADGHSPKGFKIVWSKNENPTYPTRDGDRYHFVGRDRRVDWISPFDGDGTYYVRVCEYLGDSCGIYSNEISIELKNSHDANVVQIREIRDKTRDLVNNRVDGLLAEIKELKSTIREQQVQINHLKKLKEGLLQNISTAFENAIKNFITYGVDDNTKKLGEGERAAVMYSYKKAFDKLPETEEELEDAIKIANGRWPSIVNEEAENRARLRFKSIYLREADDNNPHDVAAIKVMAYGLRQKAHNRNLNSERAALKIFKGIFRHLPMTTEEWNDLQAITYSGATR